jgi:hypothetical protein
LWWGGRGSISWWRGGGKVFLGVCCNFGGSGERVVICLVCEGVVGLIGVCDGSCVVAWYCLGHMVSGILCD